MTSLAFRMPASFFRALLLAFAACLFATHASAQTVAALSPAQRALVAQAGNQALSPAQRQAVAAQIQAAIVANPALGAAFVAAAASLPPAARARATATVGTGLGGALATLVVGGRTADADAVSATVKANPAVQSAVGAALAVATADYLKANNTAAAATLTNTVVSLVDSVKTAFGAQLAVEYNDLKTSNPTAAGALSTLMTNTGDTTITTSYTSGGGVIIIKAPIDQPPVSPSK